MLFKTNGIASTAVLFFAGIAITLAQPVDIYQLMRERGAVVFSALWTWPGFLDTKSIGVCWENPAPENEVGRQIVREAIASSWEANSALVFLGEGADREWIKCPSYVSRSSFDGIRIRIRDEISGVRTQDLGAAMRGLRSGMVLNFTFLRWQPRCQPPGGYEAWIKDLAVHEFGHALGFTHEQNRTDTPVWCNDPSGTNPDTYLTFWDAESEMNYCSCDQDAQLSSLDIEALQTLYGKS